MNFKIEFANIKAALGQGLYIYSSHKSKYELIKQFHTAVTLNKAIERITFDIISFHSDMLYPKNFIESLTLKSNLDKSEQLTYGVFDIYDDGDIDSMMNHITVNGGYKFNLVFVSDNNLSFVNEVIKIFVPNLTIINSFYKDILFFKHTISFNEADAITYNNLTDEVDIGLAKFDISAFSDNKDIRFNNAFELISACNKGYGFKDSHGNYRNMPATYFVNKLAEHNGWNKELDKSIDMFKDIDDNFKPSAIVDSANVIMRLLAARTTMLNNNNSRREALFNFLLSYPNKRIIIWVNSTEFANSVLNKATTYNYNFKIKGYHDKLPKEVLRDTDGNIIYKETKTGKRVESIIGASIQKRINLERFANGDINVLLMSGKLTKGKILTAKCDLLLVSGNNLDLANTLYDKNMQILNDSLKVVFMPISHSIDKRKFNNMLAKSSLALEMDRLNEFQQSQV
jgi:hypothetical protein